MSFRSDLVTILSGGLPALLDDPSAQIPATSNASFEGSPITPARVEEIAPTGTFRDKEPFLMSVSKNQILVGTAAVIGALALIMVVRR